MESNYEQIYKNSKAREDYFKEACLSVAMLNRLFYISHDEYYNYIDYIVGRKIDEVIFELNIANYTQGTEQLQEYNIEKEDEALDIIGQFAEAKANVAQYYKEAGYAECVASGLELPEKMKIVSILEKISLKQEVEGPYDEGNGKSNIKKEEDQSSEDNTSSPNIGYLKIKDTFILIANSNYRTRWEFTYTVGPEGKIVDTVQVKHEPIINL